MFPPATSRRFCFHTDLPFPSQPPAPLQPTGGKHVTFVRFCLSGTLSSPSPLCRQCRHFVVTVATLSSRSPLCRHSRHFVVTVGAAATSIFFTQQISACSSPPLVKPLLSLFSESVKSPLCHHRRQFVVTVATFVVTIATFATTLFHQAEFVFSPNLTTTDL